jgi:hypothetical protein
MVSWCRRNPWRAAAYAVTMAFAAAISYDLWHIPVQIADSLGEILDAQRSPSTLASFVNTFSGVAYFRPMRIAQIKAIFDLAQGHYHLAYRGFHVVLLSVLLLLFTRALRVETARDLIAATFALTVLIGLHTFIAFVREAFPINHFLEIAVLCLGAVTLAQSRGGWAADLLAAVLFVVAALTLESGVLVWVVLAAAWLAGLRGVSGRAVIGVTALLAGYFVLRFGYLDTGLPGLTERSAGFLFERLEPDELERRFGAAPLIFYAYNVAASFGSVLFSEPRDGVLAATRAFLDGEVPPHTWVALLTSVPTTVLIAVYSLRRVGRARRAGTDDRDGGAWALAVMGLAVLPASAAISYAYTKDEIVAVAGVFYAFAAFAAVRALLDYASAAPRTAASIVTAFLFVLACGWTCRTVAVDHVLRWQAFRVRNDWTLVRQRLEAESRWPSEPQPVALIKTLEESALATRVPNPNRLPEWNNRWFRD